MNAITTSASQSPRKAPSTLARALLALLAAVGLIAGAAAVPASAAPPPPFLYVGLGDSYAAGVGGDQVTDPQCGRTLEAYPALLGRNNRACGSATTDGVILQAATLDPTARKVTVTVGGNDVNALQTTAACLQGAPDCLQLIAASETAAATELPGKLANVIAAIRAKTPHAQIILTGYPHLFEVQNMTGASAPLQPVAAALNHGADVLNASIEEAAAANQVGFVSVTEAFAGHGWPSADPWIHAPTEPGVALHPTSAGYALGYAPLVRAALGAPVSAPGFAR